MNNIGLCGAHRTGKTTLAISLSEALKLPFIPINAGDVFAAYKLNPSQSMDVRNRLYVQQQILAEAKDRWFDVDQPFICDRTPIDMAAYLLSDVKSGELDDDIQQQIMDYIADCYRVTCKYFPKLILVPPTIPLVAGFLKGAINKPVIHGLHYSMLGLLSDAGLSYQILPKACVVLSDRVEYVSGYWRQK